MAMQFTEGLLDSVTKVAGGLGESFGLLGGEEIGEAL